MSEVGGSGNSGMETGGSAEGASVGEVSAVGEAASSIGGIEAGSSVHEAGGSEVSASSTEGIAPAFTETEIAIDPVNTSYGLNQILETPETLEQHAQISVEHYHNESIDDYAFSGYIYGPDSIVFSIGSMYTASMDKWAAGGSFTYRIQGDNVAKHFPCNEREL